MAESSLPALAFVVTYTVSGQSTRSSAVVAIALALILATVRLIRHQSPRHALTGLFGVAIAAFVALRTGRAEDYFLPGLLLSGGYATAIAISIFVRWPLVGVVVGQLDGSGTGWRSDRLLRRLYARASWLWVGMFMARLAVQLPFYLAGAVVALGIARTAMGVPLFAVTMWVTYRWVRVGSRRSERSPDRPSARSVGIID